MADLLHSTQHSDWYFPSKEKFHLKQIKFYKKNYDKIDKYTHKHQTVHASNKHVPPGH